MMFMCSFFRIISHYKQKDNNYDKTKYCVEKSPISYKSHEDFNYEWHSSKSCI